MKRSEMMLAGGLLLVVVGYLAGPSLLDLVTGSGQRLETRKLALKRELAQLKKLNRWKHQSLARPEANGADRAEEQYRNWVWSLAESIGKFEELNVTPGRRGRSRRSRGVVPVQVQLTCLARFGDIQKFLYHFYQADLLHRIVSIQLETDTHDGDPTLDISLVAEGLSLPYADSGVSNRDTLFPRTEFVDDVGSDDLEVTVKDKTEFPTKKAFRVRAGAEFLDVTKNEKGKWTVERGESADDLDAETTVVELATLLGHRDPRDVNPVHRSMKNLRIEDYRLVNPFARGIVQLIILGSKRYTLGDPVRLTASVSGIEPKPSASYVLVSPSEELSIDKTTGLITWKSNDDQEPGEVQIRVQARIAGRTAPLFGETTIRFSAVVVEKPMVRNDEPVLAKLDDVRGIAGQVVEFTASATDREDGKLSFRLAEGAPEGATIEAETGKFRWVPDSPGTFKVGVTVSDDGSPAKKNTATLTIEVTLNAAEFTVLIASITRNGKAEAWLRDQLNNRLFVLRPGSRFKDGDVDAEVVSIENQAVVFRIGKNEHRVKLGESLEKLREIDAEKPAEKTEKPVEKAEKAAEKKTEKPADDN